ncbi:MAG: hypothetical protein IJN42_01230, partial [Clostridia bacterium]|nr:hypothetical protein [Clostridia bacterium]
MLHNAKRGLSVLMAVLMMLSMLTAIVLPASASTEPPVDAYAKITGELDGDVIVPDENVYFVNTAWATTPPDGVVEGDEFEYTYGDGVTWGNGKTYRLTYGINTFTDFKAAQAAAQTYAADWAYDTESYADEIVIVFAPGKQTSATSPDSGVGAYSNMTPAAEENITLDDLIKLTLLGPQAGKTPVADNYLTSKAAAKVINNDRSTDSATEFVFSSTTYVFTHANSVWDGFAFSGGAKLFAAGGFPYLATEFRNCLALGIKNPSGHQFLAIGGSTRQSIIKFYDNYFDFAQGEGSSSQDMYGNLIDFDGNVFTGGKVAKTDQYQQAWHIKLYPTNVANATAEFYGEELAARPVINVTNNAFADWESKHCLRFPADHGSYTGYNDNAITFNINNNSFMDCGTYGGGDVIMFAKVDTQDKADSFTFNLQDNYVNFSDEVFADKNFIFVQGSGAVNKEGSTDIQKSYKWNIWGNKIVAPNTGKDNIFNSCGTQIDLSGNLFTDNQGNVLPMRASWVSSLNGNWTVQSDLYASGAMKGGIREMFTVRELGAENAAVLYNYFQMRSTPAKQNGRDYIAASLSLLLKDGVEFDPDTLLVYDDDAIVYEGMYLDEACTQKMDKITQADLYPAAGKTIWAKATLTEGGTTLTVKYRVTTP